MFIILLNYIKPLSEVDLFVVEHREFLERHYATGQFLVSGRKEPRTGGVILATAQNKTEIENVIQADPFYREHIAEYQVIEFIPSMTAPYLEALLQP